MPWGVKAVHPSHWTVGTVSKIDSEENCALWELLKLAAMGGGLKGAGETDVSLTSIGEGYQPAKPQYARHCDHNHPQHHLYSHVVHPGYLVHKPHLELIQLFT